MKNLSPDDLFRKIAFNDDQQAFKELFFDFYPSLCVFAGRYVDSPETCEDIVQDTFFHVFIIFICLFFSILQNTKKWVKFHVHALGDTLACFVFDVSFIFGVSAKS